MRPSQHGPAAELLAVIRSNCFGQAPCLGQMIEDAHEVLSAYCPFRDDGDGFMGGVIDNRQVLDAAPFCRPVEHKIH